MTPAPYQPDVFAARLADVHARLAVARDHHDILAAVARAAAPFAPHQLELRYLHGAPGGATLQPVALWRSGALVHDDPLLSERTLAADAGPELWAAPPREPHLRADSVDLPLHADTGFQGLLTLRWSAPHDPGDLERLLYRTLLATVAAAVAGLRRTLAFEAALAEARALYRVSARIVEAATPADLLAVITDLALSAGAAHGTLLIVEPGKSGEDDTILVAASHAAAPELRVPVGGRHAARAMPLWSLWRRDPDAPVTVDDIDVDPRVDSVTREIHRATGVRAVLLLPLRWQARTVGFVHLGWQEAHWFSDAERRLFRGLARQAAAILDNRLLFDRTQRAIDDNRNQQETLEDLLDHLPIGVTVMDPAGNRRRINRVGLALCGVTADEARGERPLEIQHYYHGTDRRIAHEDRPAIRSMATGQLVRDELDILRRDGTRITVESTAAPTRDERGELVGCVLLYQDITARVAAARERDQIHAAILAAQAAALAERSTPLIPLTDEILVMPLVGAIDRERGAQIQTTLIDLGGRTGVRAAILDLTGVRSLDEPGAAVLVDAARGLRLRGVAPIFSGLRPDVAWTLVSLTVDLDQILVESTLQSALARARRLATR